MVAQYGNWESEDGTDRQEHTGPGDSWAGHVAHGSFAEDPAVNPNAYQWGGAPGGAAADVNRYRALGQAAQGRQGAQINQTNYLQDRGQQSSALALAQSAAMGQTPSVAEMQMRQGMQAAQAGAASQAASARGGGGNLAAAQRQAAMTQGGLAAQTNQQAGMLRAQEMSDARGQYLNGALGMGQQSSAIATNQAQLEQQQHGLNDQTSLGYENLGFGTNKAQMDAQMQQQKDQMQAQMQRQQINADLAKNENDNRPLIAKWFSDERLKKNIQPTNSSESVVDEAYKPQDDGKDGDTLGATKTAVGLLNQGSKKDDGGGELLSLLSMFSDERLKKNVSTDPIGTSALSRATGIHPKDAQAAVRAMRPVTYEYKDQVAKATGMPGKQVGILAQDAEKTPTGAAIVEDTPAGKAIDIRKATGLALAAAASQQRELDALKQAVHGRGNEHPEILGIRQDTEYTPQDEESAAFAKAHGGKYANFGNGMTGMHLPIKNSAEFTPEEQQALAPPPPRGQEPRALDAGPDHRPTEEPATDVPKASYGALGKAFATGGGYPGVVARVAAEHPEYVSRYGTGGAPRVIAKFIADKVRGGR